MINDPVLFHPCLAIGIPYVFDNEDFRVTVIAIGHGISGVSHSLGHDVPFLLCPFLGSIVSCQSQVVNHKTNSISTLT
jgi:hypothetical protein